MDYFSLIILIVLGLLPSFIWLCFFLSKDVLPEPKWMVLKIFIWGMLSTLPIILVVIFFFDFIKNIENIVALSIFLLALYILFWATTEEVLKYLVVKYNVLRSSELDEPVDIMLYMIIAGLGFAALENILVLLGAHPVLTLPEMTLLAFLRFISATIGHALWSGLIGYYMALSFFEPKKRKKFLFTGIGISSFLHGLYNFAIMGIGGILGALIVITILIGLFIFIFFAFKKLKKMKSVCKIQ